MSSITVKVIKGRETWEITGEPQMTFGDLRKQVEGKAGAVEGGLRLLHKGKSFPDGATLASAKVASGARMMALATAKQRDADARAEKTAKSARDSASLDAMRERTGSAASATPAGQAATASAVRGDEKIAGQTSVLLVKGRERFRANLALSASVGELKAAAARLDGMEAAARDMKVVFKGRFLDDGAVLSACGVQDGAAVVLLFAARHHDARDASAELDEIARRCGGLEEKVRSVTAKARSRLLDSVDLSLAKSDVAETFARLQDNLQSVQGQDERREALGERLRSIEETIEDLRKIL